MSESALLAELHAMLNDPHYDPVAAIVEGELKRGFRVVRPGDKPWFRIRDWKPESVASIDGNTVRLVLIEAWNQSTGVFTHTVDAILRAGYRPAVLEPTKEFAAMLKRRGWHGKRVGHDFETRETVWRPK
jgi:hypothetical protein